MTVLQLSGTKQREILQTGKTLPSWFTFPEVHNELRFAYRPRNEKGFVVYFLGIPASGKSTAANLLQAKLREIVRNRQVSVLDGDVIRLNISKGLGFSRIDRSINVQRIGYVVSEIVKHNGIAIVANIAPFEEDRVINRSLVQKQGDYIEIFVKTSLRSCIRRDPKGLYRKAKAGILKNLTGYNDTFETPKKADLVYNGESKNPESEVKKIMLEIEKRGLI